MIWSISMALATGCTSATGPGTPLLWVDRSVIELGPVELQQTVTFSVQLGNEGGGAVKIEGLEILADGDCAFTVQGPDVVNVTGEQHAFVRGEFSPSTEGRHQVLLAVLSDDPNQPSLPVVVCATAYSGEPPAGEIPDCIEPPADAKECEEE